MIDNKDAIFLPNIIHGCDDEVYIIHHNPDSEKKSFEIFILNYNDIINLNTDFYDDCKGFVDNIPMYSKSLYAEEGSLDYKELSDAFLCADYIDGVNGSTNADEVKFLTRFAYAKSGLFTKPMQEAKVFNHTVLYTDERISSVPYGIYKYETRESDDEWAASLERNVVVNFSGTILSNKPLLLGKTNCVSLSGKNRIYFSDNKISLSDYISKSLYERGLLSGSKI